MTSALGRAEKTGLRKVSKATNIMDRRILHARQLFNERLARAESEYYDALERAIIAARGETPAEESQAAKAAPPEQPTTEQQQSA